MKSTCSDETRRSNMDNARPVDEMTFREASAELDGIIRQIESNTLELEDTLKAYERGVALIASLQKRLSEAEQKVDVLMGELSGQQDDQIRDTTLS
ncbi:MAG: exodeoxyribonuclease VII small subunit [Eggerthellaceae bacterium]|nr:exodeoxyribonuclease VII small subunit [Eggerthellaceae bacterium]